MKDNPNHIPFNKPYMTGNELNYIAQTYSNRHLSGDGPFTKKCHHWIEKHIGGKKSLLTHSCTGALEMSAILSDLKEGDEIIMPSYTFVSTANAFVLRGARPVFIDIRPDTLNLDENQIESAITVRTKVIVVVHYAGVSCEMNKILEIANRHKLIVIEDSAQGLLSTYCGKFLGTIGDMGAYSFHETKNIISGEGGCLLLNSEKYVERAEIIREKGTDRSRFLRGEVDKYTWQDIGSSFLPGEIISAFLFAQLEESTEITNQRMKNWNYYHFLLQEHEDDGLIRRPIIPENCQHNAHMYYILLPSGVERSNVLNFMKKENVFAVSHYVPLHNSHAGMKYGRAHGRLDVTESHSKRLVRLPLWVGLEESQQRRVVELLMKSLKTELAFGK